MTVRDLTNLTRKGPKIVMFYLFINKEVVYSVGSCVPSVYEGVLPERRIVTPNILKTPIKNSS